MTRPRLFCFAAALIAAAAAPAAPAAPAPENGSLAFVHASVIPMDSERVWRDQTVVVEKGRIAAVGPSASTRPPRGARIVDASGLYVAPGLADMHVHLYTEQDLTVHVVNGVTTVFNLNGRPAHLSWRRRVADGTLLGPTIYSAGPTFDHPRTPADAVAEVDRQAAEGYDAVKIYNQVGAAEYPALTAEAKKKGLVLVGHIAREPGFAATLSAGQSIAHAEEYVYTFFNDDPDPSHEVVHALDTYRIPKAVAMTREAGISVIPTLVAFHDIVRQATGVKAYLRDPHLAYLAPSMRAALEPERNTYAKRFPPDVVPGLSVSYEFQRQLVKALHGAGVPILAGTDVSWLGVPGFSLVEEIENFQDLGFTPYEALRTATVEPARFLRREADFGVVAVGRRADLVLTRRNPLEDVRALEHPSGVVAAGRWIPAAEAARLLAAVPTSYRATLASLETRAATDMPGVDRELAENDPFGVLSSSVLISLAGSRSPEDFAALLSKLHHDDPGTHLTAEETVNQLGYDLLAANHPDTALAVFRLNTELYPSSGNTWDSLAETYLHRGDEARARELYARALAAQP
ncbi:MAG: amidohydrolase family protein, partial [Syntrophomonadaceae bacterium]